MSLLEWKKLAKQKTELGNKINFVHDTILKNQLGEKTSQESLQKVFKPITTKLDDVAFMNLNIPRLKNVVDIEVCQIMQLRLKMKMEVFQTMWIRIF